MTTKLKNNKRGFTIVEVLIVLAIVGLIMLIVFLAVPALQRNARNTGMRSDASAVLSGVGEYVANNNGALPTGVTYSGSDVTFTGTGTSSTSKVRGGTVVVASNTTPTGIGTVNVAFGYGCNNTNGPVLKARAVAALFLVETSNTATAPQCVES